VLNQFQGLLQMQTLCMNNFALAAYRDECICWSNLLMRGKIFCCYTGKERANVNQKIEGAVPYCRE